MNLLQIKDLIVSDEYGFLKSNEHLGDRVIMIGLGGSHAYGTNIETSDLDVRGCALNSKEEILTNQHYEQFVDEKTDTTIYAFNKLISLLCNCNPNTIEMLGLNPSIIYICRQLVESCLVIRIFSFQRKQLRLSVVMRQLSLEGLIIKQQDLLDRLSESGIS